MDAVESKWYEMDMSLNDAKKTSFIEHQKHVEELYCRRILHEIYPGP